MGLGSKLYKDWMCDSYNKKP